MAPHDVPVDGFATPTSFTRAERGDDKPDRIDASLLDEDELDEMPAVAAAAR